MQNAECRVQNCTSSVTEGDSFPSRGSLTLTRAEIDALNKHNEKVRREMIQAVFNDIEELLESNKRLEHNRAEMSQSYVGEQKHTYAEALCVTLLIDLQMIREKYEEENG